MLVSNSLIIRKCIRTSSKYCFIYFSLNNYMFIYSKMSIYLLLADHFCYAIDYVFGKIYIFSFKKILIA